MVVATFFSLAAGAAPAPVRALNGCGPCLLVATIKSDPGTALFDGTAASTPTWRSGNSGFRLGDRLNWRLTFHLTAQVSRAFVKLGTPREPGRYLFTLCAPCLSGARGELPLGPNLVRVLNAGVTCHRDCPPAAAWPLGAYIDVRLTSISYPELSGQLRFCAPNQYRHRNSCAPPGY